MIHSQNKKSRNNETTAPYTRHSAHSTHCSSERVMAACLPETFGFITRLEGGKPTVGFIGLGQTNKTNLWFTFQVSKPTTVWKPGERGEYANCWSHILSYLVKIENYLLVTPSPFVNQWYTHHCNHTELAARRTQRASKPGSSVRSYECENSLTVSASTSTRLGTFFLPPNRNVTRRFCRHCAASAASRANQRYHTDGPTDRH